MKLQSSSNRARPARDTTSEICLLSGPVLPGQCGLAMPGRPALVCSVALPVPEPPLVERVVIGIVMWAGIVAVAEAIGLLLRITPPWETFGGWAPRILF
jgi:hypothetical protein